jgi:hypothetical protein
MDVTTEPVLDRRQRLSEIISEMLEVSSLASLHQLLRVFSIESKMPNIGIVVDRLPSCHTGKKRIHYRELLGLAWKLYRAGVRDHQSNVVSYYARFLDLKRTNKIMDLLRCGDHVDLVVGGNRGVADARQIWRDNRERFGEQRNDWPPHPRSLRVAMQNNDCGSVTSDEVMQLDVADLGIMCRDRRGLSASAALMIRTRK